MCKGLFRLLLVSAPPVNERLHFSQLLLDGVSVPLPTWGKHQCSESDISIRQFEFLNFANNVDTIEHLKHLNHNK